MQILPYAVVVVMSLSHQLAQAQDGVLDLSALQNYANQTKPAYITRDNTPPNNRITNAGATLGRVLFHDRRLSRTDSVSCSSCHRQERAFSDTATASVGVNGTTGRHSMRLINSRFSAEAKFFWDERATSLENQTSQPIQDHKEMGFSGTSGDPAFADLVTKLNAIPEYRVMFTMTFGSTAITETRIQQALSQFIRSIQSFDSKYDAGRAVANDGQPFPNFTAQENAGKSLFLNPPPQGGAGCAACHAPPEFAIDPNSRNNGATGSIAGGTDLTNTRSPSLRDLVGPGGRSNGAFMHDGSLATLAQVINHYNQIPADNTNLDPRLRRPGGLQNLNLSQTQKDDLAAFLRTLSGVNVYADEKWADPFNATHQLQVIILPADAVTVVKNTNSTATILCQAAPNLSYQLQSSSDLITWIDILTLAADATGKIEQTIATSEGQQFYRFIYTLPES
jgi:cytochrome c peroxidase